MAATIIIPTRRRAPYLDVALASIAPQAAQAGAEVLVIDDGPDDATADVASRHGARYVAHDAPRGINVARNTGLEHANAELLVFVDDDVEVRAGWLDALLTAAAANPPEVGCFGGPIHARFEDHAFRACGREDPPITSLELGDHDRDADAVWGANMALRRAAIEAVGRFDERHRNGGDEEDWQARLRAQGGRVRYVAGAAVDHRRAGDDARLRSLARAAHARGRASRRYDVFRGEVPPLRSELRVLAGCFVHTFRFACLNGIVMTAHSIGRVQEAWKPVPPDAVPGVDDFLSGTSGTFGGLRGGLRGIADVLFDVAGAPARARLRRAAARLPRQHVLVLSVVREGSRFARAKAELQRSRHHVTVATTDVGDRGKFANLDALLATHSLGDVDWLLVVDDDVDLPRGFLDLFLAAATEGDYVIAQPAHRLRSHAAWPHTRRRATGPSRSTTLVEIGPVTAFRRDGFAVLLPFPDLRMGWGLDAHWGALAREHSWRLGIVDATPIAHAQRPAGDAYSREQAIAEAREFLATRPYVTRDQVR